MNETESLPALLCGFFSQSGAGIPFVPEVWRDGAAAVWLTGSAYSVKEYVDGSAVVAVPFEVRVRCDGTAVKNRLDVLALFAGLAEYVKTHTPADGIRVLPTSGAAKSAVYDDGTEEYRMGMAVQLLHR